MVSKDIQGEEGLAAERAHQPHSQVDSPDVCTNGGPMRSMGPLCSPQPSTYIPFECPQPESGGIAHGPEWPPLELG